ncbi:MAG: hypothetical protein AAGF99_00350 [Bacteroidota bacterium]
MNTDLLYRAVGAIEGTQDDPTLEFDMHRYEPNECGTACCIAGHVYLLGTAPSERDPRDDVFEVACSLLGIGTLDGSILFAPGDSEALTGAIDLEADSLISRLWKNDVTAVRPFVDLWVEHTQRRAREVSS